jgi:exo-beta-1,3-glucanase (GH17 family)
MSQANVSKDISSFKQNGILNVRTYAQECNQLDQILTGIASAGGGMTVIAAVWVDGKYFRILKCNVTGLFLTDCFSKR